jgi:hypothetical protein
LKLSADNFLRRRTNMKKPFFTTALTGGLILLLALLAAGCDNLTDGNDNETVITAREAADEFYATHSVVLEKSAGMLVLDDEEPVNAARKAYGSLNAETRALLPAEKAHLDGLKEKLEDLKSAEERGVYYTLHDLESYLTEQPENDADTPYTVVYVGNETAKAIYRILAAAERYVDLNLGGSGVPGITGGTEEGRAFIVSLILPDSLEEIPDGIGGGEIFANFANLKSVYGAGVQKIGAYAFAACPVLASVSLPSAVSVGDSAFYGCVGLTAVNLPMVTTIGSTAFRACTGLTTISLPSVVSISADYAFRGCVNLATVNLPSAVHIGTGAFRECGLTSLSLPVATTIGISSFLDCGSLATVSIPAAVSIGNFAFQNCSRLPAISMPEAVSIGQSTFSGCANLTTINVPKVVSISLGAFAGCSSLETISLPSAGSIVSGAFANCSGLTTVTLGAVPPTIGNNIFGGAATAAKTITIKTPYPALYTAAGTPWSDKLGNDTVWINFWDSSNTKGNLTVALEAL